MEIKNEDFREIVDSDAADQNGSEDEYEKYRVIQDQKYISSMDKLYNRYFF